jgi:nicotinamide-nucleotide amidase
VKNKCAQPCRKLAATVIRLLTEREHTLALAESCTGGYLTDQLTNVPGASAVLLAGLVTYSNVAKKKFLGVRAKSLAKHGAVSATVAREMADGARRRTGADYTLAITGVAGPSGGTLAKPVGTVFIALAAPGGTTVEHHFNTGGRLAFKRTAARQALASLHRAILKKQKTRGHECLQALRCYR